MGRSQIKYEEIDHQSCHQPHFYQDQHKDVYLQGKSHLIDMYNYNHFKYLLILYRDIKISNIKFHFITVGIYR